MGARRVSEIVAFAVILANSAGQFAIMAILFGTLQRHRTSPLLRTLLTGCLFAVCALLSMAAPAQVGQGVFVDTRGVVVGLAGAFAGWPATLIAVAVACLYRISLGGIFVAGCVSIVIAAGMGLLWRRFVGQGRATRTRKLVALGLMIALHPLPLAFVPQAWRADILLPTLSTILIASVMGALTLGKLIGREERLIAQERRLTADALQDPLTGLLNRRGFEQRYFAARTRAPDDTVAVMLLDVDFFKRVNDTHGHDVGDEVLRRIAATLQRALPASAGASRHGGEEFAVLLTALDGREVLALAETLRREIAAVPVAIRHDLEIPVTVSIGVALCQDGQSALQDLLGRADRALYRAKRSGRNRVEDQGEDASSDPAPRLRVASAR